MATNTEHYNLVKPDYADAADVAQLNDNMDIIDSILWQLANAGADEELLKKVQEILDKIGETDDTGGSTTLGSVMAKINQLLTTIGNPGGGTEQSVIEILDNIYNLIVLKESVLIPSDNIQKTIVDREIVSSYSDITTLGTFTANMDGSVRVKGTLKPIGASIYHITGIEIYAGAVSSNNLVAKITPTQINTYAELFTDMAVTSGQTYTLTIPRAYGSDWVTYCNSCTICASIQLPTNNKPIS